MIHTSFRITFGIAVMAAILLLSACDILKSGLGTELQRDLGDAVGKASLGQDTFWYNGNADSDMRTSTGHWLKLDFSKRVRTSTEGIAGSFTVTWTDAANRQASTTMPLGPGMYSADRRSWNVDLSPVLALFDGVSVKDGLADCTLQVSGLLCDEGDQAGRAIPLFKGRFSLKPLFTTDVDADVAVSTMFATTGVPFSIPLAAAFDLESWAEIQVAAHGGSSLPAGLDASDFVLSKGTDGTSLVITPQVNLMAQAFKMKFTVRGFRPLAAGSGFSRTFVVSFDPTLVAIDGVQDSNWTNPAVAAWRTDPSDDAAAGGGAQAGNEATGLHITNDGTYLYVGIAFSSLAGFWENDRIVLMFDEVGRTDGQEASWISAFQRPASTFSFANGQADLWLYHQPGADGGLGNHVMKINYVSTEDWSGTAPTLAANGWEVSRYGWKNPSAGGTPPAFLEYRFKLSTLGFAPGDVIRCFASVSNYWGSDAAIHATDILGSTLKPADSLNVALDFDTALTWTIQ